LKKLHLQNRTQTGEAAYHLAAAFKIRVPSVKIRGRRPFRLNMQLKRVYKEYRLIPSHIAGHMTKEQQ
jgi:hypothetical protein